MSVHDDDILDFDFVDDDTRERSPARTGGGPGRVRRRRSASATAARPSSCAGAHGLTPLLRLVGLVAFAIILVVLLVVWVQGCSSDKQRETYNDYMTEIGEVGSDSAKIGEDLADPADDPGSEAGGAGEATSPASSHSSSRVCSARSEIDATRPAHPGARARDRGAAAARERHAAAAADVQGDRLVQRCLGGRAAARRAGDPARGERRRLGRSVPRRR